MVTTCSHIFCLECSDRLGLSRPVSIGRHCPACQILLQNPDDVVSTVLNPTEDYKTSVLSGLDPNTIMECAGRALVFWAYQTTQEVFYQEFLVKSLTEKYGNLSKQMDKVIHNANSEISALQIKVSEMQHAQEELEKKNHELADLYKDKSKKFNQITNLYNLLKTRSMKSQIQSAASDSVSQTLNSLSHIHDEPSVATLPQHQSLVNPPPQTPSSGQPSTYAALQDGVEQLHRYQRSGTGSSRGAKRKFDAMAMPPPGRPVGQNTTTDTPRPSVPRHRTQLPLLEATKPRDSISRNSAIYQQRFGEACSSAELQSRFSNTHVDYPSRPNLNRAQQTEQRRVNGMGSRGTTFEGNSDLRSTYFETRNS